MDKRYRVDGMFSLEVEGEDTREARAKAKRIFRDLGIKAYVTNIEKVEEAEEEG